MEYLNSKSKKLFFTCMVATFMGQIYVNPFTSSNFRFSLSVVAFTLMVYWYKELDIISTALFTGTFLFIFRTGIQLILTSSPLTLLSIMHFPVIIYYLIFGVLLKGLRFRQYFGDKFMFVFLISFSDSIANIIEMLVRMENIDFKTSTSIFFVGLIRGSIIFFVSEGVKYYEMLLRKEEHEERYKQLVIVTSNLKSEVFFLKKSMDDMENAMEKSYRLYQGLKDFHQGEAKNLSFQALSIAKDIHEIKKDYMRVSEGLERILPEIESYEGMYIKDLFDIIETSYKKNSQIEDKIILMEYICSEDLFIKQAYEVISIINNLITNSIEAIESRGRIKVVAKITMDHLEILIRDNGKGIEPHNINIIFQPGYTTKFDEGSGRMNSGIGLTHVAYLVRNTLEGQIAVQSKSGEGTEFIIRIPLGNIQGGWN